MASASRRKIRRRSSRSSCRSANPQQLDGTGLGLPISQRLATLLNGSLTVESEVDIGSVFRLRLPRMTDLEDGAPQPASFPRKSERPPAESAA